MKSKSLMLMGLSLVFGLIAAVGITKVMAKKGEAPPAVEMGPIIVADKHIEIKAELTKDNVRLENWPVQLIPEGAATDLADVEGKIIVTRLRRGQALIQADIYNRNELPGLSIPPGYKVINLKVPAEDAMNGLLNPGDKVDIIGVFPVRNGSSNGPRTETQTFLKAIRVFNVNGNTTAQRGDEQRSGGGGAIVGVLVTEKQSEKIVWAKSEGEIRLALRGEDDNENTDESNTGFFAVPGAEDVSDDDVKMAPAAPIQHTVMTIYEGFTPKKVVFDKDGVPMSPDAGEAAERSTRPRRRSELEVQEGLEDYGDSDDSVEIDYGFDEDQYQGQ